MILGKNRSGLSLFEILIALALGILLIGASVLGTSFILRSGKTNEKLQTANGLSQEMLEKIRTIASVDWNQIYNRNPKGPAAQYYVATNGGPTNPLNIQNGSIPVTIEGVDYSLFFTVENVYRDLSENIAESGGIEDPSTQKITVYVHWLSNGEVKLIDYITRWKNAVFVQTDWRSLAPENEIFSSTTGQNNRFATSSGISTSTAGQIKLEGF